MLNQISQEDERRREILLKGQMTDFEDRDFVFILNRLHNYRHARELSLLVTETVVFKGGTARFIVRTGGGDRVQRLKFTVGRLKCITKNEICNSMKRRKHANKYMNEYSKGRKADDIFESHSPSKDPMHCTVSRFDSMTQLSRRRESIGAAEKRVCVSDADIGGQRRLAEH